MDELHKKPFGGFDFSPAGAAIYQLGPFGTAAKELKEWTASRRIFGTVRATVSACGLS